MKVECIRLTATSLVVLLMLALLPPYGSPKDILVVDANLVQSARRAAKEGDVALVKKFLAKAVDVRARMCLARESLPFGGGKLYTVSKIPHRGLIHVANSSQYHPCYCIKDTTVSRRIRIRDGTVSRNIRVSQGISVVKWS